MIKKRIFSVFLVVVLTFSIAIIPVSAASDVPLFTILHTNDVHGAFKTTSSAIGHDVISSIYNEIEGTKFLLDAGDATQGVFFVGQSKGEAAIEIMNAVGYDAMTLGNHEFDYGWQRAIELFAMANFPMLSHIKEDVENLVNYVVIERDDIKLGVFGLTTPETQFKSGGGFEREFGNIESIIEDAKDCVEVLRETEGVDYVICLAHLGIEDMGYGTSYDIRDNVEGIDLIIDGHSHTVLEKIVQVEGATPIVSTGSSAANLGKVEFYEDSIIYVSIPAADTVGITPDADVAAVVQKWDEAVKAEGDVVVASIPEDITVLRANERTKETIMGNIVTDAMRAASGADIAFENGGGIRDKELKAGDVTKTDLVTILPFGNVLQMAEVTGAQIKEVLEVGVSLYPATNGGFVHISGASYTFDPMAPVGSKITEIIVGSQPIDLNKKYKLATNDFSATGGDNWTALKEPFKTQLPLKESNLSALEQTLIWYLNQDDFEMPELGGRVNVEWAFPDIEGEDAFIVSNLVSVGILSGYPDGTFHGEDEITNAQLAVVLANTFSLDTPDTQEAFVDVTGNEWYASAVQAVVAAGIMTSDDGVFMPNSEVESDVFYEALNKAFDHAHEITTEINTITRMEMARALYSCINEIIEEIAQ